MYKSLITLFIIPLIVFSACSVSFAGPMAEKAEAFSARRQASGDSRGPHSIYDGLAYAVLRNGPGDGSVSLSVDAYGTFGYYTPARMSGNVPEFAHYDPYGSGPCLDDPAQSCSYGLTETVYESVLFFGPHGNYLSSMTDYGGGLPDPGFVAAGDTWALSRFSVAGFDMELVQELGPAGPAGSILTQTYRITNRTGAAATFPILRYFDGDLYFNSYYENDWGGMAAGGRLLYEFDTGDDRLHPVTYLGIQSFGGEHLGYTIQTYEYLGFISPDEDDFYKEKIISAGGIPPADLNAIQICESAEDYNGNGVIDGIRYPGDVSPSDGLTDFGNDVTLTVQNTFTAGPGETVEYITHTYWGSAQPSSAVTVDIVDPNPELLDEAALFQDDVNKIARLDRVRKGAAADGVSSLVLRAVVDDSAPVTFTLDRRDGRDGTLRDFSDTVGGGEVTVLPRLARDGSYYAAAIYTPPADYSPNDEDTRVSRPVMVTVNRGAGDTRVEITLVRPPVVLVHDMWGGPDDFSEAFVSSLKAEGYVRIVRADYRDRAVESFDPVITDRSPIESLREAYGKAMHEMRFFDGIAVAQVDVVAHGTGGLVARAKESWVGEPFFRTDTWMGGEFHKLITVATPHLGTPLADYLAEGCGPDCRILWEAADHPIGPVMNALRPAGIALENLGQSTVPGHAITGIAPDQSDTERAVNGWLSLADRIAKRTADDILGGNGGHDTITPLASQRAFGPWSSVFNGVVHHDLSVDGIDSGELESPQVLERITMLLHKSPEGPYFGLSSPPAAAPGEGHLPLMEEAEALGTRLGLRITSPLPGQVFSPGEVIPLAARVRKGTPLVFMKFVLADRHVRVSRYSRRGSVRAPFDRLGRVKVACMIRDRFGRTQVKTVTVRVALTETIESIAVNPSVVHFAYPGQEALIGVKGVFQGEAVYDVSSPSSGSAYSLPSASEAVVRVSRGGKLTAVGTGTEVVRVTNGGLEENVLVKVGVTNTPPVLSGFGNVKVVPGRTVSIPFSYHDPDGDPLTVHSELPSFCTLIDSGDGTGVLEISPRRRHRGRWPALVTVTDDGSPGLGNTSFFTIRVRR